MTGPTYMTMPRVQITAGATTITDRTPTIQITRTENQLDQATITYADAQSDLHSILAPDVTTVIQVKNQGDASWKTPFAGIVRFQKEGITQQGEITTCQLDGLGLGFPETVCNQEYGTESTNPTLDTIKEILTDSTKGIIPAYTNKLLGTGAATGYTYDYNDVEDITGALPYLYSPFKSNSKLIQDAANLLQGIKGASAGVHFITTTDNHFRLKTIGANQTGWTKYLGGADNTAGQATLTQGYDFIEFNFQNLNSEANCIIYHSNWLYPGNGDLCENTPIGNWSGITNFNVAYSTSNPKAGSNCITGTWNAASVHGYLTYGSTLGLDLTKAGGKYNIPTFGFWWKRNSTFTIGSNDPLIIEFHSPYSGMLQYFVIGIYLDKVQNDADVWHYAEFPVGPYWYIPEGNPSYSLLAGTAGADWSNIQYITWDCNIRPQNSVISIDGAHFVGWVIRVAHNSTSIAAHGVRTRPINDPFAKGDSLKASDDSGSAAILAYSELLRAQTKPIVGSFTVPMLPDLLPGQFLHIHAKKKADGSFTIDKDMRVTKLVHNMSMDGLVTTVTITDDLTNSQTRAAYDDKNTVAKAQRPGFQDREATGIKMREIDITQPWLEKDYPS